MNTQIRRILFGILCVVNWVGVSEATENPPTAVITPDSQTVTVGQTAFFDGSGSHDPDPGQIIVAYMWTFPPQAVMIQSFDSSTTYCKFNTAGTFSVTLMVQDNTGRWSLTEDSCTVTVNWPSNPTGPITWYVSPTGNDGTNDGRSNITAFHRIQTAIDFARNDDTVIVLEGTYFENIDFRGKNITLKSNPENPAARANTIIDGNGNGTVVSFTGIENTTAALKGITVRGGGSDTEQLMAHWPFDSSAEDAKNNHDGTLQGNPVFTTVLGEHIVGDGALSLDGTGDFVTISGYKGITGRQSRTCSAWIKPSAINANNVDILYWGSSTTDGAQWRICLSPNANNTQAYLRVEVGSSGWKVGSVDVANDQWHHVAVTWSDDGTPDIADAKLYVDGQLDTGGSSSACGLNTGSANEVRIGSSNQSKYFSGLMDDVRVYARAMKVDEIKTLMTATKNPTAAHWKLDDNTGMTASDSSGNGHTATLQSMDTPDDWIGGLFGSALDFDGTDDFVKATGYTGISGTNARTTAAWIKTTDVVAPIVYWGTNAAGGLWDMRISSTGKLRVVVSGGPAIDGSTTINTGQWVHVAAVLPGGGNNTSNILLYVNGVLETGTTVAAGTINTGTVADVRIGANETGHYYMGQIDDARIYSEALSAEQIKALSSFPGPEAHWTLNEAGGASAPDSSPHGFAGSLQNMGDENWVKGVCGNALELNGTDEYVTVNGYSGISGSRARTCSAWIKTTDVVAPILYWGTNSAGNLWDMRISSTGKLRVVIAGGPAVDGSTTVNTGQWVHVAAVLPEGGNNTNTILLYVNGILETGLTVSPGTINTGGSATVRIGRNDATHYFAGTIDDVRIYRRALTAAEIRTLATGVGGIRGFGTAASINQCVIENNQSTLAGGGIWNVDGTISQCLIRGNTAVEGGGLADCGPATGTPSQILNCIVAGNSAEIGGGLLNCTATIRNCTIVNNDGGLLNCPGSILNCIVWDNGDDLANSPDVSYSCVPIREKEDILNYTSSQVVHGSPNFGADYRIQYSSSCLNTGMAGSIQSGETDYFGKTRSTNGRVDIGADEFPQVLTVGGTNNFQTIQEAIDTAQSGQVVVVKRGVWTGNGNRDLTFRGEKITVQSENPIDPKVVAATVIDCGGSTAEPHRGFIFNSGETNESVLAGFMIRNGYVTDIGGGIFVQVTNPNTFSKPTIRYCIIENCHALNGGGIGCGANCYPVISDCIFRENQAEALGGGAYIDFTLIGFTNCIFQNNRVIDIHHNGYGGAIFAQNGSCGLVGCKLLANKSDFGGAVYVTNAFVNAINSIFVGNSANTSGGAVFIDGLSDTSTCLGNCTFVENHANQNGRSIYKQSTIDNLKIANGIFWGNSNGQGANAPQIEGQLQNISSKNTCFQNGFTGIGNIDRDPTILSEPDDGGDGWGDDPATEDVDEGANDDYGDLRLLPGSPCIDAGTNNPQLCGSLPSTDLLGGPRKWDDPDKTDTGYGTAPIADMGAYEYCGFVRVEAGTDRGADLTDGGSGLVHLEGKIDCPADLVSSIRPQWRVLQTEPWDRSGPSLADEIVDGRARGHADAMFAEPGIYTMILEAVTPYGKAVASDTMVVTVEPWGGTPPEVEAGPDQTGTNCVSKSCLLQGSVTDDRRPNGYLHSEWTMISGPANCWVEFENANSPETTAHFYCEGTYPTGPDANHTYILMLSATDGTLDSSDNPEYESDTVMICVGDAPSPEVGGPRVYAGADDTNENEQTSSYDDHLNLSGTLLYPTTATGITYIWTQVGGPIGSCRIDNPESLSTPVYFNRKGDYTFRLTATQTVDQNKTLSSSDEVRIQVLFPYKVCAGEDKTIRLPKPLLLDAVNSADNETDKDVWVQDVTSSEKFCTDDDLPSGIEVTWSMVKGPGTATFNPPLDITPDNLEDSNFDPARSGTLNPSVQFSKAGKYTLRLSAATSTGQPLACDEVEITAQPGKLISAGGNGPENFPQDGLERSAVVMENGDLWVTSNISCMLEPIIDNRDNNVFSNVIEVSMGAGHCLLRTLNNELWGFGNNLALQVNRCEKNIIQNEDGTESVAVWCSDYTSPVPSPGDTCSPIWKYGSSVSATRFCSGITNPMGYSMFISPSYNVISWGRLFGGLVGVLGHPDNPYGTPYEVLAGQQETTTGILEQVVSISAGAFHSLAVERIASSSPSGRVFAWGKSQVYLGNPGSQDPDRISPIIVLAGEQKTNPGPEDPLQDIVAVSAGWVHSLALEKFEPGSSEFQGRVFAWGEFGDGRLGVGNQAADRSTPCIVVKENNEPLKEVVAVSAGADHSMALDKDGRVWIWGANIKEPQKIMGQLGLGDLGPRKYATLLTIVDPTTGGTVPFGASAGGIVAISAGAYHNLAVDAEGSVWAWGSNSHGQLGIGLDSEKFPYASIPVRMKIGKTVVVNQTHGWVFDSIQQAIDGTTQSNKAVDGDVIVVYPGEYFEHVNFRGKDLTLTSLNPDDPEIVASTIINGGGGGNAVIFSDDTCDNVNPCGTLRGFTITNAICGIDQEWGSTNQSVMPPLIENNRIQNISVGIYWHSTAKVRIQHNEIFNAVMPDPSQVHENQGIDSISDEPIIWNNIIYNNNGAGIKCKGSGGSIVNNWITQNGYHPVVGATCICAGIFVTNDSENAIVVANNTIVNNAEYGILFWANDYGSIAPPIIQNCIIRGNGSDPSCNTIWIEPHNHAELSLDYSYSCVECTSTSDGNISAEPQLGQDGISLSPDSPCIDAGDNSVWPDNTARDITGMPRIILGKIESSDPTVDIGASEFQSRGVSAGKDQMLVLSEGSNSVRMSDASVTYKASTKPINPSYVWELVRGPDGWTFSSLSELNPTISFTLPGIYVFQLAAYEDRDGTGPNNPEPVGYDKVIITVLPGVKVQIHSVETDSVKASECLILDDHDVVLNGDVFISAWGDSLPAGHSIEWSCSHPYAQFSDYIPIGEMQPELLSTKMTFPDEPGQYTVTLTVKDPGGRVVGSDSITVNVNRPTLTIRADCSAPLDRPARTEYGQTGATIGLFGMAAGGQIDRFSWVQLGGPTEATIHKVHDLATTAQLPQPGVYEFGLLAEVDNGNGGYQAVGFASAKAELKPGIREFHLTAEPTAEADTGVVRLDSIDGIVNLTAVIEGEGWDYVQWSVVSQSREDVDVVFGGDFSTDTWVTFSLPQGQTVNLFQATIRCDIMRYGQADPVKSKSIEVILGTAGPTTSGNPDPSVQPTGIKILPSATEIAFGPVSKVQIRTTVTGEMSSGAEIRWHLAGYRNFPSGIAAFDTTTGSSSAVGFSAAGSYAVVAEVLKSDGKLVCWDAVAITVTYPDVMVRAWIEDGTKNDSIYTMALSSTPLSLGGSISPDGYTANWFVQSGPQSVSFSDPTDLDPTVTFSQPGTYTLAMAALTGTTAVGMDTVTIQVYSTSDWPAWTSENPFVFAGNDKFVMLKDGSASVNLSDAFVLPGNGTVQWSCVPDTASFSGNQTLHPTVLFTLAGQYELTLTYGTKTDKVYVTVYSESEGLVAEAGTYDKVVLPNALLLDRASAASSLGGPTYEWRVTAPIGADVAFYPSPNELNPLVSFPKAGSYNLQLTVRVNGTQYRAVDSTLIEVEKAGSDTTEPIFGSGDFAAAEIPGQADAWIISVSPEDKHSGVRLIELWLGSDENGKLLRKLHIPAPYPWNTTVKYVFRAHEYDLPTSPFTLSARVTDGAGNSNDPLATLSLTKISGNRNVAIDPKVVVSKDDRLTVTASVSDGSYTFKIVNASDAEDVKCLSPINGQFTYQYPPNPNPESKSLSEWNNGVYLVLLTRDSDNITFQTSFDVAIGLSSETLTAKISSPVNYPAIDSGGQVRTGQPVLPRCSEGTLDLQGTANFNGIAAVEYKVDLIDGEVNPMNLPAKDWSTSAESYRVKTCTKGASADGWVAGSVENGTLATMDLTDVPNGIYEILLTARVKTQYQTFTAQDHTRFILDCPLKIGNVTFSQEDLTIPVAGIPLTVVRTYNSFNRNREGDFGFGWELSFANLDIKLNEGRSEMGGWTQRNGEDLARDVTLTMPDGKRVTFAAKMTGTGNTKKLEYESPEGVEATLTTKPTVELVNGGGLYGVGYFWKVDGTEFVNSASINEAINLSYHDIPGWDLTMQDGTEYRIRRAEYGRKDVTTDNDDNLTNGTNELYEFQAYGPAYLESVKTKSGETLVFEVADTATKPKVTGVKAYASGVNWIDFPDEFTSAIDIDRDEQGRIIAITAPDERELNEGFAFRSKPSVQYSYTDGNLIEVKKLKTETPEEFETTKFLYDGKDAGEGKNFRIRPQDHFVVGIKDDRGIQPIRYVYDDQGRLIETIDAQDHSIVLAHHVESKTETVTDRANNDTVYYYNERGNVTDVLRYEGTGTTKILRSTTSYLYTGSGKNIDKPTQVSQLIGWNNGQAVYAVTETRFGTADIVSPRGETLKVDTETVVDPVKNKTVSCTDGFGRLVKSTQYKPIGENEYIELASTWNTYTPTGLLVATETTTGTGSNLVRHSFTANIYDERNRLLHTVQVDTQNVTNFAPYYILDGLVNSTGHPGIPSADRQFCIVTSYQYDKEKSGSEDQPYAVTDPYCPAKLADQNALNPFSDTGVVKRYSKYDSEGRQIESWYEWEDPADSDTVVDRYVYSVTTYDKQGRVTKTERIIDDQIPYAMPPAQPNSSVCLSQTTYNSIGKPDTTTDENKVVTKYLYDQTGNLVETLVYETQAALDTNLPLYLANANQTTGLLSISRTMFDAEGRAIVTVGPYAPGEQAVGTETVYDALGRVSETRRWKNVTLHLDNLNKDTEIVGRKVVTNKEVRNAWDGTGTEPVAIAWKSDGTVPNLADNGRCLSRSHTDYDAAGRVYRSYAPTQSTTGKGVCTQEIHYDVAGRQVEVISLPGSAQEAVTETHYDGPRQDWTVDARGNRTSFEYDSLGRLIKTTHPTTAYKVDSGTTITSAYGPVYSHVGYDGFVRKRYETPPVGSAEFGGADKYKIFSYDAAGRLTMVMMSKVDDPQDSPDRGLIYPIYRYYYDIYGNQIGILDPLGRVTVMEYDSQNRPVKKYQPYQVNNPGDLSNVAVFPAWNLLINQRPAGQLFESTTYDPQGRMVKRVDYKGQATLYYYFPQGSFTQGRPGQLRYEDSFGNDPWPDTNIAMPDPVANPPMRIAYEYDRLGRKVKETVTPGTNEVYTTWYDKEGRVEVLESPQGDLRYEYSPITGNKTATTSYPAIKSYAEILTDATATTPYTESVTRTVYTYDALGRLYTVQVVRRNGAAVTEAATTYGYNDNGSRGSVLLPNGVYTQYDYNGMNRLAEVVNFQTQPTQADPNKPQLSRFQYGHYAGGMRATAWERQKPVNNVEKLVICRYDGMNRLSYESHYEVNSTRYGYQAKYTYDLAGNRTERRVEVKNASGTTTLTTQYAYDSGNDRLQTETTVNNLPFTALPWGQDRMYAYAGPEGSLSYGLPGSEERIGSFGAFWRGLPSVWNRYAMILLAALLPLAAFGPILVQVWRRIRGTVTDDPRPTLSLYHRCLCILLAYIFLIGPETFVQLAGAEVNYSTLSTQAWGQNDRTIEYGYDDNGAQIRKTTKVTSTQQIVEELRYDYTLRGQLQRVVDTNKTWGTLTDDKTVAEYRYNPSGIRVGKTDYVNGVATTRTDCLIDPYNPTGYAQVLQETEWNITNPSNPVPVTRTDYALGDDVISQTKSTYSSGTWTAGQTECLLYDGHGSTRQLIRPDKSVIDNYNYDGYGVMLGDTTTPNPAQTAATKYLYAGEQYDKSLGHYYLRARYYNPSNGRFNQTDPFAGNTSDPQSLHKYLYAHCNPVNNIDPTGKFTLAGALFRVGVGLFLTSALLTGIHGAYKHAKSVTLRMNQTSIFYSVFSGGFSWNDWKQVILGFKSGTEIGILNVLDTLTFRLISPLNEYRDSLWLQEGLDESWVGKTANVFAWAGTASLYAAAAVWTWNVMGGGTMDIAVQYTGEPGLYFHVQYGSNGLWQEALGNIGRMPILPVEAGSVEGAILTGIPVLYPEAVMTSGYAYNCVVAAIKAFGRGWGL